MATVSEAAVAVRGLRKGYDGSTVLHGVDLDVRHGETLVILGGSGSGKSTLLRCMVGLEVPDAGTVRVLGVDVNRAELHELNALRRRMGMAFQAGALFGSMTVAQNVELPLVEFTDLAPTTRHIVARIKLGMVGLEDSMHKRPDELSGGMQKRASFARALALDPEIAFFDEPSAGLDPVTAAGIDALLLRLKKAFDVTLVVVTHELESAFTIADRLALIHEGRVLIVDEPAVVRQSQDPIVRRFLDRQALPADGGTKFRQFLDGLELHE